MFGPRIRFALSIGDRRIAALEGNSTTEEVAREAAIYLIPAFLECLGKTFPEQAEKLNAAAKLLKEKGGE